jgi:hypothetical protein
VNIFANCVVHVDLQGCDTENKNKCRGERERDRERERVIKKQDKEKYRKHHTDHGRVN